MAGIKVNPKLITLSDPAKIDTLVEKIFRLFGLLHTNLKTLLEFERLAYPLPDDCNKDFNEYLAPKYDKIRKAL